LLLFCLLLTLALPVAAKELTMLPLLPEVIVCDDEVIAPLEPMAQLLGAKLTVEKKDTDISILTYNGCRYESENCVEDLDDGSERFLGCDDALGTHYAPLLPCIKAIGGTVQFDDLRCVAIIKISNPSVTLELPLVRIFKNVHSFEGNTGAAYLMNLDGTGLHRLSFQTLPSWEITEGFDFPYFPLPAISPDNSHIVYSPTPDTVFLREANSLKGIYLHRSAPVPGIFRRMYYGFTFSPNGKRLLFFEETKNLHRFQEFRRLYLINIDGTREQVIDDIQVTPGRWSLDGKYVLLGNEMIVDATTCEMRTCTEEERHRYTEKSNRPPIHFPSKWNIGENHLCADGKHVLFMATWKN